MDDAPYLSFVGDVQPLATPALSPSVQPVRPNLGEAACDDLPAAVGWMIVGSYTAILAAFAWTFIGAGDVAFNIGICAFYLAMYLGVPWLILKEEMQGRGGRRPDLAKFLEQGLSTWTGHVSGREALAQILTIPGALTFAALGIGIIIRNAG